jgi:hypothetical protein
MSVSAAHKTGLHFGHSIYRLALGSFFLFLLPPLPYYVPGLFKSGQQGFAF